MHKYVRMCSAGTRRSLAAAVDATAAAAAAIELLNMCARQVRETSTYRIDEKTETISYFVCTEISCGIYNMAVCVCVCAMCIGIEVSGVNTECVFAHCMMHKTFSSIKIKIQHILRGQHFIYLFLFRLAERDRVREREERGKSIFDSHRTWGVLRLFKLWH